MSLALAWFSAPAALRKGCSLFAVTLALGGCARASLVWPEGGAATMPDPPTSDAAIRADTGVSGEPDSSQVAPPADAGSSDPDPVTDASLNQEPSSDAGDPGPTDPDDRTPSPDNQAACPAVAPEPPFNVSPCVEITLRCLYGQSYECTCYAAGWLCLND